MKYKIIYLISLLIACLLPGISIAKESDPCPNTKTISSYGKFVNSYLKNEKIYWWQLTSAPFKDKNQVWTISFLTVLYGTTSPDEALKKGQYIFKYMTNLSEPVYERDKTCVYSKLNQAFELVIASPLL